mgnify:CR=1 FL=1
MQTTIYYRKEDKYLLDKVENMANRERKSKSACLLTILEEHFEAEKKVGEILKDLGALKREHLKDALNSQKDGKKDKLLGEIMLEEGYVEEIDLDRALRIQKK